MKALVGLFRETLNKKRDFVRVYWARRIHWANPERYEDERGRSWRHSSLSYSLINDR